ncbi:hypothetical protein AZI86_15235 [Bdellovibrio bacteriovorus]|uniref:Methyltransferase type 11 domain-containing protein n=1 Tax=Bdellovibrio bacteriovorus TaxID=959 RepID=A0A150WH92_BDEBC|nr:class I SAM-dependent methyltransferase [Bdellovibrio bacteriovorus]KYG63071.1 hypothetical protein AZI86_15235 [Bdellovibrio bacteriovorus]
MKLFIKQNSPFSDLVELSSPQVRRLLDLQFQSRCLTEKKIFKNLDLTQLRVLDFGAGMQDFRQRHQVVKYTSLDPYLPADWKSLSDIPEGEKFDLIVASEVFEHLENPTVTLRELFKILQPGGRIYLTTPFMAREHGAPADFQRWTQSGLEKLLTASGFKIEQSHRRGNLVTVLSSFLNFSLFKLLRSPAFILGLVLLPLVLILLLFAQASFLIKTSSSVYLGLSVLASKVPSKDL